jgi:protoporphyrinogen oxidase
MTVYILGGGPTGLAIAHGLTEESNVPFVVIERDSQVGGLAQTLAWGNHGCHDLGPHKLFTLDQDLMARVDRLLPMEGWLNRPKRSSIYLHGHFLPYPPSPLSLMRVFGLPVFASMGLGYGRARVRSLCMPRLSSTFEEDLQNRVGRELYEVLFKPIALKLWGDPVQLDARLSQGRVQTPSFIELVAHLLRIRSSSDFEALTFRYPRGGLQILWDALLKKTRHQGTYILNQEVTSVNVQDNRVCRIRHRDRRTSKENEIEIGKEDYVFSTLPLMKLPELLCGHLPLNTIEHIKEVVQLNDLLLAFLKVDRPSLLDESWVFVPDPGIAFHRVSEQESFDPEMTLDGSIVCCEIMSNKSRPMKQCSDEKLLDLAKGGLVAMGYNSFSVLDQRVIRLSASYPVFRPGFKSVLDAIMSQCDRITNFRTLGRQGAFKYIGTLDAMDVGYGAVRCLLNSKTMDTEANWERERERTNHYPVLD